MFSQKKDTTMRIAALYDIHGNLPALEAALDAIARADVDALVVGGDVVAGPMPTETLACLRALPLPVHFIRGNADREVAERMAGIPAGQALPAHVREIVDWVAQQLSDDDGRFLAGWPLTLRLPIDGIGTVLFCHATPQGDTPVFTRLTPEPQLLDTFCDAEADLVVCGHTHMPFDRQIGGVRVVNAGSVGMPYGEPGAHWLLLGPGVQARRADYDRERAAARIRASNYPQREDFAANNVLNVPSEAEALAAFTPMEIGASRTA